MGDVAESAGACGNALKDASAASEQGRLGSSSPGSIGPTCTSGRPARATVAAGSRARR